MGILFNLNQYAIGLNPISKLNNPKNKVAFTANQNGDSFQITSPERLFNEAAIRDMIAQNPELKKILSENKIPIQLNMNELQELKNGHCRQTQEIAAMIAKNLPAALKNEVNIKTLKEGALLHDFGKVLIPPEILNKEGKLTDEERKIMNLHSEIGYHLLKNTISNYIVLQLVRYHHNNKVNHKDFIPDINLQILNIADKYSALTENRVYKKAFTPQQALMILYNDVQKGEIHPTLYNALVTAISATPATNTVKMS
ncbi:HD domain-containing protein [bacterium]|nr:HD domain-containing protein [bacterium]